MTWRDLLPRIHELRLRAEMGEPEPERKKLGLYLGHIEERLLSKHVAESGSLWWATEAACYGDERTKWEGMDVIEVREESHLNVAFFSETGR